MKDDLLPNRVDVTFVGDGLAHKVFIGLLDAHSPVNIHSGKDWYHSFLKEVQDSVGKKYLPVYRMADGEYRFLLGRRFDKTRRPRYREIAGFLADRLLPYKRWSTSWGESYSPRDYKKLKLRLLEYIHRIATKGFLALFLYDNGLHAFEQYNRPIPNFLKNKGVVLNDRNYVPFHFPVECISQSHETALFKNRSVLIASSLADKAKDIASNSLSRLGASRVTHLAISPTSSLTESLSPQVHGEFDIALVAAGIGAANIICQLENVSGPVIDIGGYINCLVDAQSISHSIFKFNAGRD